MPRTEYLTGTLKERIIRYLIKVREELKRENIKQRSLKEPDLAMIKSKQDQIELLSGIIKQVVKMRKSKFVK